MICKDTSNPVWTEATYYEPLPKLPLWQRLFGQPHCAPGLTVGELREALADAPDHLPIKDASGRPLLKVVHVRHAPGTPLGEVTLWIVARHEALLWSLRGEQS